MLDNDEDQSEHPHILNSNQQRREGYTGYTMSAMISSVESVDVCVLDVQPKPNLPKGEPAHDGQESPLFQGVGWIPIISNDIMDYHPCKSEGRVKFGL